MSDIKYKVFDRVQLIQNSGGVSRKVYPQVGMIYFKNKIWYIWSDIYDAMFGRKKRAKQLKRVGRQPEKVPHPEKYLKWEAKENENYIFKTISQAWNHGGGSARYLVDRSLLNKMISLNPGYRVSGNPEEVIDVETDDEAPIDLNAPSEEPEEERAPPRLPRRRIIMSDESGESEDESDESYQESEENDMNEEDESYQEKSYKSCSEDDEYQFDDFCRPDDEIIYRD